MGLILGLVKNNKKRRTEMMEHFLSIFGVKEIYTEFLTTLFKKINKI